MKIIHYKPPTQFVLPMFLLFLGAAWGRPISAQEAPKVRASLICNAASVAPGQSFKVGLLLDIEPGWHVYWLNPGDSGYATVFKLQAEAGCTISEVDWPIPQKFEYEGLVTYGYERQALLTVDIDVPNDAKIGQRIKLVARAEWLSCKVECVPGEADLEASVLVGTERLDANIDLFKSWQDRFPLSHDSLGKWVRSDSEGTVGRTVLKWNAHARDVWAFPATDDAVELKEIKVSHEGRTTTITFVPAVYDAKKLPHGQAKLLLLFKDDSGRPLAGWVRVRAL